MLYPDIVILFSRSEDHVENRGTKSAAVWVMPSASWLSVGPSGLRITPTPLCQGGTESTVSQGASLKPSQLVLEDSMWRAVGCYSLVHCPFFLAMVIVGKEADSWRAVFRISTAWLCSVSWKFTSFTARTWSASWSPARLASVRNHLGDERALLGGLSSSDIKSQLSFRGLLQCDDSGQKLGQFIAVVWVVYSWREPMLGDSQRQAGKPVRSHHKESGGPFSQSPDRSQRPLAPSPPVQPGHRKQMLKWVEKASGFFKFSYVHSVLSVSKLT